MIDGKCSPHVIKQCFRENSCRLLALVPMPMLSMLSMLFHHILSHLEWKEKERGSHSRGPFISNAIFSYFIAPLFEETYEQMNNASHIDNSIKIIFQLKIPRLFEALTMFITPFSDVALDSSLFPEMYFKNGCSWKDFVAPQKEENVRY